MDKQTPPVYKNLRRFRTLRGLTQQQLADACSNGLGQTAIARLETGSRRMSVDELVCIAAALHIHPRFFFADNPLEEMEQ